MTATARAALIVIGVFVGFNAAATVDGQSIGAQKSAAVQTLGVQGASNSTPSLTAAGRTVAVVWTAAKEGVSNVYLAVSTDGGATFSAPRRVNDQDGDAGATNEQPPRVVITGSGAASVFTVLWSKRDPGPQQTRRDVIRIARSTDGAYLFAGALRARCVVFGRARMAIVDTRSQRNAPCRVARWSRCGSQDRGIR